MNGDNGLIFAYGVTNSGKTYTIQGGSGPGESERGVIPRVVDVIFNSVEGLQTDSNVRFLSSLLRICGCSVTDNAHSEYRSDHMDLVLLKYYPKERMMVMSRLPSLSIELSRLLQPVLFQLEMMLL